MIKDKRYQNFVGVFYKINLKKPTITLNNTIYIYYEYINYVLKNSGQQIIIMDKK